jgi:hypothetical protein
VFVKDAEQYTVGTSIVESKKRLLSTLMDSELIGSKYTAKMIKHKWEVIKGLSRNYDFAEQAILDNPPANVKKWPASKYAAFGTNSNTFVRYIVKQAGLKMVEINNLSGIAGMHPGDMSPKLNPFPIIWGRNLPWEKDIGKPEKRPSR